ncbi:MAG: multidrug effflux MFS transporter, partial [Pseudomonadota bacterium]
PRFLSPASAPSLFTLVCLAAVGALAMNMFLPALPAMAAYFGVSYSVIQFSVTGFLAMNAICQIFIGPLSDRYGRRPVVIWSMVLFCLATAGTIMAPTAEIFLACRLVQAFVVAGLVLSRAAIRDMYDTNKAASMIGYVTMCMAVVPMLGPMLGGWLQSVSGWVANFWVMLAVGLGVLVLVFWDMGETNRTPSASIGAQFRSYPELFRSRRFWAYCISAGSTVGAYFAYLGGAAFIGNSVFNLTPAVLGLYFGAPALGYAVGNGLSGALSVRWGIHRMILTGAALSCIGMVFALILVQIPNGGPLTFFGPIVLVGLGNGMTLPNATSGMMSVRPHLAGSASGIGGTIMTGGGAILAGITGSILTPGMGPEPLIFIMLASSCLPFLCIWYITRREQVITTPDV